MGTILVIWAWVLIWEVNFADKWVMCIFYFHVPQMEIMDFYISIIFPLINFSSSSKKKKKSGGTK